MKQYEIGLYEKAMPELSWPEKLAAAKEAGYDFVEISIDASEEKIGRVYMPREERRALRGLLWESGMPLRTMNVSALTKYALGDEDDAVRERGMDIARRSLALAADLGVRIVMFPGYDVYFGTSTPETVRRFTDAMNELKLLAARFGTAIGFETMENAFMNTVEKGMRWVETFDSAYVQLYPDIGNTTNAAVLYGTDPLADLRLGHGHILAFHLKETKPGVFREIPYGEGHVDFPAAIETVWALGVRRFVTEFWYDKTLPDWRGELLKARTRFADILDRMP
ncbi:MAG: L-ribulose-5-phosphate 3-epimerase [Oscillospiraceae bacterium]|nr:L-ribulose-5-phosphate 3-epimerase [Oscillospiraceae bacterium]